MREILVVNPRKKARKTKGATTMPKKRKKRRAPTKRSAPHRSPRRNPRRKVKRAASRAGRALGSAFMGLNFQSALKNALTMQVGMLAAKWAAKRWSPDATETDPASWNYSSYIKGALGAALGAVVMNTIKRGQGQKALEGGLALMLNKIIQNELIPQSPFMLEQFGAEDWTDLGQDSYVPTEYLLTGDEDNPYAFDDAGNMYPADDRHRLPEISEMGNALEPVGPLGGGALEPVGPLGYADDVWADAYLS